MKVKIRKNESFLISLFVSFQGLSPPSQAIPWEQKPPPHWNGPNSGGGVLGNPNLIDHKPPQVTPQTHAPPQSSHAPQMGGYMPQYWYQPETNPSLLT